VAIRILSIQDMPVYNDRGQLTRHRLVTYMVDEHGPFGLDGTPEELTLEEVRRRIHEEATKIRVLISSI